MPGAAHDHLPVTQCSGHSHGGAHAVCDTHGPSTDDAERSSTVFVFAILSEEGRSLSQEAWVPMMEVRAELCGEPGRGQLTLQQDEPPTVAVTLLLSSRPYLTLSRNSLSDRNGDQTNRSHIWAPVPAALDACSLILPHLRTYFPTGDISLLVTMHSRKTLFLWLSCLTKTLICSIFQMTLFCFVCTAAPHQ